MSERAHLFARAYKLFDKVRSNKSVGPVTRIRRDGIDGLQESKLEEATSDGLR
jgi:hypothetical protein